MTGYNNPFPDRFEACGACAGTGTVMETNVHGVPVRKVCRPCRGQGTLRRRPRPTTPDDESKIDSASSEEEVDESEDQIPQTLQQLKAEYTKILDEAELRQAKAEASLMNRPEPSDEARLDWMRLHSIRLDAPDADDQLDLLAQELYGRVDESSLHEIRYIAILCGQLNALKIRIKSQEA